MTQSPKLPLPANADEYVPGEDEGLEDEDKTQFELFKECLDGSED